MIGSVIHRGVLRLGVDLGALVIAFVWGARAARQADSPNTSVRVKVGAEREDGAPRVS